MRQTSETHRVKDLAPDDFEQRHRQRQEQLLPRANRVVHRHRADVRDVDGHDHDDIDRHDDGDGEVEGNETRRRVDRGRSQVKRPRLVRLLLLLLLLLLILMMTLLWLCSLLFRRRVPQGGRFGDGRLYHEAHRGHGRHGPNHSRLELPEGPLRPRARLQGDRYMLK